MHFCQTGITKPIAQHTHRRNQYIYTHMHNASRNTVKQRPSQFRHHQQIQAQNLNVTEFIILDINLFYDIIYQNGNSFDVGTVKLKDLFFSEGSLFFKNQSLVLWKMIVQLR